MILPLPSHNHNDSLSLFTELFQFSHDNRSWKQWEESPAYDDLNWYPPTDNMCSATDWP